MRNRYTTSKESLPNLKSHIENTLRRKKKWKEKKLNQIHIPIWEIDILQANNHLSNLKSHGEHISHKMHWIRNIYINMRNAYITSKESSTKLKKSI